MPQSSMVYGSRCEVSSAAASQAAVPESIAAVIDRGGFGVFQKQLLMMLGLAWIADSMEVMIVRVVQQALMITTRQFGVVRFSLACSLALPPPAPLGLLLLNQSLPEVCQQ